MEPMSILHPAPLGANTTTELVTIPALAGVDQEIDDGGAYLVFRNHRGDVTHTVRAGDGDPMDRARVWEAIAQAAQHAAEEARQQAVNAGRF